MSKLPSWGNYQKIRDLTQQGKWEIVAFHNAPVQKREEEDTGFVIHVEGADPATEATG